MAGNITETVPLIGPYLANFIMPPTLGKDLVAPIAGREFSPGTPPATAASSASDATTARTQFSPVAKSVTTRLC